MFGKEDEIECKGLETFVCIHCLEEKDVSESKQIIRHTGEVKRTCKSCDKHNKRTLQGLKRIVEYPSDDYSCPICERTMQDFKRFNQKKLKTWVLDHCHHTGKFRGWICHHCNTGIGALKDDPVRVKKALEYLNRI